MALKFVMSQPALAPLFVAVGLGVSGSAAFAYHYLSHNQDVVIRRKNNSEPWLSVPQDKNTKLFTWNKDFWASRVGLPDPSRSYMDGSSETTSDAIKRAKANAIKKASNEAKEAAH
ncbi:hypothetical protein T439DRAFT_327456 [Meredithblackwellia eburnea MCA 4105]